MFQDRDGTTLYAFSEVSLTTSLKQNGKKVCLEDD